MGTAEPPVAGAAEAVRERAEKLRSARGGRPVLGVEKVLAQKVFSAPNRPKRRPVTRARLRIGRGFEKDGESSWTTIERLRGPFGPER